MTVGNLFINSAIFFSTVLISSNVFARASVLVSQQQGQTKVKYTRIIKSSERTFSDNPVKVNAPTPQAAIASGKTGGSFGPGPTTTTTTSGSGTTASGRTTGDFGGGSSSGGFAVGPGSSGSFSGPKFSWRIDNCNPAGCFLLEIGGQGTFKHIAPPKDLACSSSNGGQVITITMKNPSNGATKDFKAMCTDKASSSKGLFEPEITGASTASFQATTGDAFSVPSDETIIFPAPLYRAPPTDSCKRGEFSTDDGGITSWECGCSGDYSGWVAQDHGCYHKVKVKGTKCMRGEFKNEGGGQTMWACNCQEDFSSWAPQADGCYHKNK